MPAVLATSVVALLASHAVDARAQTACADLSLANPVVVAGSTTIKPFIAKVATRLAGQSPPVTIFYKGNSSCEGVGAMSTTASVPLTGTADYFSSSGVDSTCTLPAAGLAVDIGASDVFAATCALTLASGHKDFRGPTITYGFVMAPAVAVDAISAEQAYLVYGFGAVSNEVEPWTNDAVIYRRGATSGTHLVMSAAIGVPSVKVKGTDVASSGAMVSSIAVAATNGNAEAAIGILSADVYDVNKSSLKWLAFQAYGQTCGYLPNSTASSFDKANVRDGHYVPWAAEHFVTAVDGGGHATNPNVAKVLDLLIVAPSLTDDVAAATIDAAATGSLIPDCAMHVTRTSEVGPLASYQPTRGCECSYLKSATGSAPADCKVCTAANAATACKTSAGARGTACNYGYCEAQ
jgi:ABC-type phosphate transport system substrate-binding protein